MSVRIAKGCKPSGRLLKQHLEEEGYDGSTVNWGFAGKYADKYLALRTMRDAEVPVPALYDGLGLHDIREYPVVARTSTHRGGSGFWLCKNYLEWRLAVGFGATHAMQYIEDAREFRVHVVDGESIKIAEKIGGGVTKNFKNGARFQYPYDFNRKVTLRRVAKQAVAGLGFDFGAVDVLYKDKHFYVLEVNRGPNLTSKSDTLERYVNAFMGRAERHRREAFTPEETLSAAIDRIFG